MLRPSEAPEGGCAIIGDYLHNWNQAGTQPSIYEVIAASVKKLLLIAAARAYPAASIRLVPATDVILEGSFD